MRNPLLVFLALSLLAGCSTPEKTATAHPWAAALRALDPADAVDPVQDITAVYLRQSSESFQVRVDLLDFGSAKDLSLDIRIGDDSNPEVPPISIHIPSESGSTRISLDPLLATVIADIPISDLPSPPRVDVSTPQDAVTGLALDGPIPSGTAPLLLTFYDTFAGRFPAEALRRWDGAHTGPRGERHGLKHLLDAAEQTQAPVVLLDLKAPENLSALDAMGVLPRIRKMEQDGLLILPDQPSQQALFGFSSSRFALGEIVSRPTFVLMNDPSHIYHPFLSKTTYLPIATETGVTQPTPDGPSLEVRRALLDLALNGNETDLLVLGGSLQNTTWGSPDMASATLAYFASRPYIHILNADDLLGFPTKRGKSEIRPLPRDKTLEALKIHYQGLTNPVLEFVQAWQGFPLSSCTTDLDQDGQPECVLANDEYLAILDPQGARLTYLFSLERDGLPPYIQLIGPSWQVAVGLSNPSLWDTSKGEAADPGAYPGAFTDLDDPFKAYEPVITGDTLVFTSLDGNRTKTYKLTESGVEVEYRTSEPVTTQIPLLVEPQTRFTPGWAGKYVQENTPGGVAWGLVNGPMVRITALSSPAPVERSGPGSKGGIEIKAFNDSLSLLSTPEDPDFSYPPGHYVPFPMAVAEIEMQDDYFLRLERLP